MRFFCRLLLFAATCSLFAPAAAAAATLTVTSDADSGSGTLREAIAAANGSGGADTIEFGAELPGQISLSSGELLITSPLTIQGPGPDQLEIDGGNSSRVFEVASGAQVSISGLTIAHGRVIGSSGLSGTTPTNNGGAGTAGLAGTDATGGGVLNSGDLTLTDVILQGNSVFGGAGGSGGDGAAGNLHGVVEQKQGGNGGAGAAGGEGRGGAIASSGSLTLTRLSITGNQAFGGPGGSGGAGGVGGGVQRLCVHEWSRWWRWR